MSPVLGHHSGFGGTEENHITSQTEKPISQLRFKLATKYIQVYTEIVPLTCEVC